MLSINQLTDWPGAAIQPLIVESQQDGIRFLTRLSHDWQSRTNRFSGAGEAFFGVYDGDELVAVGGINRESTNCGRLRRFYVLRDQRRRGIGRMLLKHILTFAAAHYQEVSLWTDSPEADRFYPSLDQVKRIAEFFGVTVGEMLKDTAPRAAAKPGPASRLEQLAARAAKLPRAEQKAAIKMLEGLLSSAA